VHHSKLNRPTVKRDVSSRKANDDAAEEEATLKLPNWYEKAELSISVALRPSKKPHSQKITNIWSMRKIRGF
jgi:hypothetical protein